MTLFASIVASAWLTVVSNGASYTFTSNQTFTVPSGTNPANQGTAFAGIERRTSADFQISPTAATTKPTAHL